MGSGPSKNTSEQTLNKDKRSVASHSQLSHDGSEQQQVGQDHAATQATAHHERDGDKAQVLVKQIRAVWQQVDVACQQAKPVQVCAETEREGWHNIRVFVSSTFKDFYSEREELMQKVFSRLRTFCDERMLNLIITDLRWGVTKESTVEVKLRTCLEELDRCWEENQAPYFINMISERSGWTPEMKDVPKWIMEKYCWIAGLSITEMEIVYAAYRSRNPHALFLVRDSSFLDSVPEKELYRFYDRSDEREAGVLKCQVAKEKIQQRFPQNQVLYYQCKFDRIIEGLNEVRLEILDSTLTDQIYEFLMQKISEQYLDITEDHKVQSSFLLANEQQKAFMQQRKDMIGRVDILHQIEGYITSSKLCVPALLVGEAGIGKSSIMAKITSKSILRKTHQLFYHFVGATPQSTDLMALLTRLLLALGVEEAQLPTDHTAIIQHVTSALEDHEGKIIICIDALNQLEDDPVALSMSWLPQKLSRNIRIIMSVIPGTQHHQNLMGRSQTPLAIEVGPLRKEEKMEAASKILKLYNKELDVKEMDALMAKSGSNNPLWISIVCEELVLFGKFGKVIEKIESFEDNLIALVCQVFERLESVMLDVGGETLKTALISTLCFLNVSSQGLLEIELQELLSQPSNTQKLISKVKAVTSPWTYAYNALLTPSSLWTYVYSALKRFLRPIGSSGEGRLDFYHRIIWKAVKERYVTSEDSSRRFHLKLVRYFEKSDRFERKVEEYPYHLEALGDRDRMKSLLIDWDAFKLLWGGDNAKLLQLWKFAGGYVLMRDSYLAALEILASETEHTGDYQDLSARYQAVAVLLVDTGDYKASLSLIERALEIEKSLGSNLDRMADMAYLKAETLVMQCNMFERTSTDQLPHLIQTLEALKDAQEKCDNVFTETQDEDTYHKYQSLYATCLSYLAFTLHQVKVRGGDTNLSPDDCVELAHREVDEAIAIFTTLNEIEPKIRALENKALLYQDTEPQKALQLYGEARSLWVNIKGSCNLDLAFNIKSMAVVYEVHIKDFEQAYRCYRQAYEVYVQLVGPQHRDTKQLINRLSQPEMDLYREKDRGDC